MKLSTTAALISSVVVVVGAHPNNVARQAPSSSSIPAPAATTSPSAAAPAAAPASSSPAAAPVSSSSAAPGVPPGAPTGTAPTAPLTTVSFSIMSQNPTGVPLSQIVAGAAPPATIPLAATPTPGSVPSGIPGAPGLPNANLLVPSNYPALDKVPPTDSPQVQQWIQDVKNSGITIPGFSPTNIGGCGNNTQATSDSSRCWWTCGGCTRQSDVTTCPDKLTWGLSYDDGPAFYTPNLLQYLDEQKLKSTFFVVGSRVISLPHTLQQQYMTGHQISVHTWSHTALTTQTTEQIIAEFGWSKKVIKDVLGVTPNTFRPPYGDIDDRVRAIGLAMGLIPIMWTRLSPTVTFDTSDFNIAGGTVSVSQVLQNWEYIVNNASQLNNGFIVLEHDLFPQSVEVGTGYILPDAISHQFNLKPIVSCLNKPLSDAYIETNDNKTNPPAASGVAVTLSSGAPGSAQATSAVSTSKKSGASALGANAVFGAFSGALAFAGVLLL